MPSNRSIRPLAILLPLAFLFAGCGEQSPDPHDLPRESKSYEAVDPAALDRSQLLDHLQALAKETNAAVQAAAPVEFHHLEVAMTPTLTRLEPHAAGQPQTLAAIQTLKQLAIKLHEAGHEGNVAMGARLAPQIEKLASEIESALR